MDVDGFLDERERFIAGFTHRNAPGQIGHIRSEARGTLFHDDQVSHGYPFKLAWSRMSFAGSQAPAWESDAGSSSFPRWVVSGSWSFEGRIPKLELGNELTTGEAIGYASRTITPARHLMIAMDPRFHRRGNGSLGVWVITMSCA